MNPILKFSTQYSFFEIVGFLVFSTVLSNYLMGQALLNISAFVIYCAIAACIGCLGLYAKYKYPPKRD
ncbi:hypothetical protein EC844_109131 [Acinetobacter calcoaceticus]|uniref:Uncharacterized protein n=1 Tax=Acinetobacter calcoaceticus TaxID=471 RepID=A0A4R1XUR1_ACICA|nr:hypothetical protein EC844_109131 [Acinetobacter calcoaceticus]